MQNRENTYETIWLHCLKQSGTAAEVFRVHNLEVSGPKPSSAHDLVLEQESLDVFLILKAT